MTEALRYPDSGQPLEDAGILRNAVYYTTAFRAFNSNRLLAQSAQPGSEQLCHFNVLQAFQEFMVTSEDILGWVCVLRGWKPGTPESSLFALLHRVNVGRKGCREADVVTYLNDLDVDGFRRLIHIPRDALLTQSGLPDRALKNMHQALCAKLQGFRKTANIRAEKDRGWVQAYNKIKHLALVFPYPPKDVGGAARLWIPRTFEFDGGARRAEISTATIEATKETVAYYAGNSLAGQVFLHDTLALILQVRFGHPYQQPSWVTDAIGAVRWK